MKDYQFFRYSSRDKSELVYIRRLSTDWAGSKRIFMIIFTISGRRRELERWRVADGLRRRDWKTNGCDKKYSSSSSEKSYHHPNKSFLISSHQEERFSQLHLCLLYLVLVSLLHCAGENQKQF